jgi:hypothetical protein
MSNRQTETVVFADDDLTGVRGSGAEQVKITVNGKSATLDLLPASLAALAALVEPDSTPAARLSALRAVVAAGPVKPARARSGPRSTAPAGPGADARAWAGANGWPEVIGGRGRLPKEALAAYESRTPKPAAASTPASEPGPAA